MRVSRVGESVSYSGAAPCGSRTCPACGPVLAAERRQDLELLVVGASVLGYVVRFATFTVRHTRRHELEPLLDSVLRCWDGLTGSGAWVRAARAAGLAGFVRVVETKYGVHNGWHPHVHALLFFRPGSDPASLDALTRHASLRWQALTAAAGLPASSSRGVVVLEPTGEHLDGMAGYVTKGWGVAAEMTAGAFKSSREHWTPQDLLLMAAAGDRGAEARFREYETATHGRRLYAPLRAAVRAQLLDAPRPEERMPYAACDIQPRVSLVDVPRGAWSAVVRERLRDPLAAVALDASTGWDVVWWLADRGLPSSVVPSAPADPPGAESGGGASPPLGSPPWLVWV